MPTAWERRHARCKPQAAGYKPAAILFDTIFSIEGLPLLPKDYLEQAVAHVRAVGGLFIADEVQPGLGRMGDHMWGYQAFDIVPDFVTMGKSLGNGHPLAALVTRPDYVDPFAAKALYFNTFAGNPLSSAVGTAMLEVIEDEDLTGNARRVGAYLQQRLELLAQRHDLVGSVRSRGPFFGLEFLTTSKGPAVAESKRLINLMRDRDVLISKVGSHDNILKMRPPLQFSIENADLLLSTLDDAIAKI
ncbi:aminotransferase class III-fold pyridoxal phosphate-dependent enzyme [Labrys neptuniae]